MHGEPRLKVVRDGFDFDLRDHGAPVDKGLVLSVKVGRDPIDGRDRVYVGINAQPFIFVVMDPANGSCRHFAAEEGCEGPWDMAFAPDGRVVITSVGGRVCVYDPRDPGLRVVASEDTWLWAIDHAGDGVYYLAAQPRCELLRFDLNTAKLEVLGKLDDTQSSARSVVVGQDGYVYVATGTTATQIVAWHIATGRRRRLLPATEESNGFHGLGRADDGSVYALCNTGNIYRIADGAATRVDKTAFPGLAKPRLSDGRLVHHFDPDMIRIGEGPSAIEYPIHYSTVHGARLFHIAKGPDNMLYGSSIMPLYLFRFDPRRGELVNLGRGAPETGEIYSFAECDGKLYYATYGGEGSFLVYDPREPFRTGKGFHDWFYNPRVIRVLGEGHCRPRAICVDLKKRVWVGSYPEYGKFNGGLFCYDTTTGDIHNNPLVIENQSICSLTADTSGELVFGGTDTTPGSGAAPVEKEAVLFAWDIAARRVIWRLVPVEGETGIANLIQHQGKLYGTTRPRGTYFVYDPDARRMERVIPSPISDASEQAMGLASDGNFYGTTWPSLYRWRPDGDVQSLVVIWGKEQAGPYGQAVFRGGGAIVDDRIYFMNGTRLLSMRLPLDAPH